MACDPVLLSIAEPKKSRAVLLLSFLIDIYFVCIRPVSYETLAVSAIWFSSSRQEICQSPVLAFVLLQTGEGASNTFRVCSWHLA